MSKSDVVIGAAVQNVIDTIQAEFGQEYAVVVLYAPAGGGFVGTMSNMVDEGVMDLLRHAASSQPANPRHIDTPGRKLN